MKPMNFQNELETLIRARYPILYVISSEEMRVQNLVVEIARKRQKKAFEWSVSTGIVPAGTSIQSQKSRSTATKDPLMALDQVIEMVEPALFIFKDFQPFLTRNNYAVVRKLKEIALHLKNSFKTIVLVSPVMEIPTELEKEVTVLNFPLPSRDDLNELLDQIVEEVRPLKKVVVDLDEAGRDRLLQAALGLTLGGGGKRVREDHCQGRAPVRGGRAGSLCREAADHPEERVVGVLFDDGKFWAAGRSGGLEGLAEQARGGVYEGSPGVWFAATARDPDAGGAGLRQELVCQGGFEPMAIAVAPV